MALITFHDDGGWREPRFIAVRCDDLPLGLIVVVGGHCAFYEGDHVKVGGADRASADLNELKAAVIRLYAPSAVSA